MQLNDYFFTVIGAFKPLNGRRAEFSGFVGPFDSQLFGQFGSFGLNIPFIEQLHLDYDYVLKLFQGK